MNRSSCTCWWNRPNSGEPQVCDSSAVSCGSAVILRRMGTAVVVLLGGIWAVVLLPSLLRHGRWRSPAFSADQFSKGMRALGNPARPDPSYTALLRMTAPAARPALPEVPVSQRSAPTRVRRRRSARLEQRRRHVLASLTGVAALMLLFGMTARGIFTLLAALSVLLVALYVVALVQVESGIRLDQPIAPQVARRRARSAPAGARRTRTPRLLYALIR